MGWGREKADGAKRVIKWSVLRKVNVVSRRINGGRGERKEGREERVW